jgi:predicted Fe-Mo cluster-binding NifX family protein
MKIMIPLADGKLTAHFGHCSEFACLDLDAENREVVTEVRMPAPPHEPGLLPKWLAERGADLVIAGGMGQRAQDLLVAQGVDVIVGAPELEPAAIVAKWVSGELGSGKNSCDH